MATSLALGGDPYAPLLIEFGLIVDGTRFPLPAHEYLKEFSLEVAADRLFQGSITLWDAEGDHIESLILAAGAKRGVFLRWGWDRGSLATQKMIELWISQAQSTVTPTGTSITLNVVTANVAEDVTPVSGYTVPLGMKISEAIRQLAERVGFPYRKEGYPGGLTIQPTSNALPSAYTFLPSLSTIDIMRTMARFARPIGDADNEPGFFVYQDMDGTLHFHQESYGVSTLAARYVYGNDPNGEVISFALSDNTQDAFAVGAGGSTTVTVDSKGGVAAESKTPDNSANPSAPRGSGAARTPPGQNTNRSRALSQNEQHSRQMTIPSRVTNLEDARSLTAARRGALAGWFYTANMTVMGTHVPQIFHHIIVEVRYRGGQLHPLSGLFQIQRINHHVGGGGAWQTEFLLAKAARSVARTDTDNNTLQIDHQRLTTIEGVDVGKTVAAIRPGGAQ